MASKKVNPRLVKIHRNYTVEDVAELLGVHKNTVRNWIKLDGLKTCDNQRPILILGHDLKEFLEKKNKSKKCPLLSGQIYCVRCREGKFPSERFVEFKALSATHGSLIGICPTCDCMIYRRVSTVKLDEISEYFDVSIPQA